MGKFDDLGLNFAGVKAGAGSEPIPNGWQHLRVERWEETETGENSKNPGSLAYKLGVSIASGEYKPRWVFTQFTLDPKSEFLDLNIGQMKAFLLACGISEEQQNATDFDPDDDWAEENLIGKELDGYVRVTKPKDGYDAGNTLSKFREHEHTADEMMV